MKLPAIVLVALLPGLAAAPGNIKGNAWGSPSAPILLEIFSDFQCPACKLLHDTNLPLIKRDFVFTGKMYLVYRYFPLQGHPYGGVAAEFVCAAAQIGKYEAVANALFAQQEAWSNNGKVEETVDAVLTPAEAKRVKLLTKEPVVANIIQQDLDLGRTVPITQTPTLLVTAHGKRYPIAGLNDYSLLKSFLDGLLKN